MSPATRLMLGITLITVPTVVYGGLTVLGILTGGAAGLATGLTLTPLQYALYRAGHAHAGVLVILSLLLQVFVDHARLSEGLAWSIRVAAPLAAIFVSGGFFGLAHVPALQVLLYGGAGLVTYSTVTTAVGLFRSLR